MGINLSPFASKLIWSLVRVLLDKFLMFFIRLKSCILKLFVFYLSSFFVFFMWCVLPFCPVSFV